jgi:glycosyltransferase involved in cell wall biosynthesis
VSDLVSVVVPAYQRAFCVTEAVDSVLRQTHPAVECIVVDDGSTDGTIAALDTMYAGDGRVRSLVQAHAGVSAARNTGVRHARGDFVTFLDSDDLMPPGRVARQLVLLREQECDAIVGTYETVATSGVAPPSWISAEGGFYWTSVLAPTRHVLAIGGFDESMATGEDLDLLARLVAAGLRLRAVDDVFTVHRFFGDNLTASMDDPTPALHDVVRRHLARRRGSSTAP